MLLGADEANAGLSFRNLPRITAMPVDEAGVADVIGAASLLVSETALPSPDRPSPPAAARPANTEFRRGGV